MTKWKPAVSHLRRARLAGVSLGTLLSGTLLGVVLMGPALGRGALINLDLGTFDQSRVPNAMWGLGPDLPRQVPMGALITAASHVLGGELTGKLMILTFIVVAFAGAHRLAAMAISATGFGMGLDKLHRIMIEGATATIWAAGPFMLTRIAVGFWPVTFTMAVLPWSVDDLTNPDVPRRRVLLWSCLFAIGGFVGAFVGGAYLIASLLRRSRTQSFASRVLTVGTWLVGQSIWIVPSVVVMTTSTGRLTADSKAFATTIDGLGGVGRLAAGMGFWNNGFQLGLTQPFLASALGFFFLGLALAGTRMLPRQWRMPVLVVAALSLAITLASAIPGLDTVFAHLTSIPVAASLRESQRFLFPFLLWIAISAPLGAASIARQLPNALGGALIATPLVAALVLIVPSAWGLERQLLPATIPADWSEAKAKIDESPGPVLALPWFQYYTSDVAAGRLSLSPLPKFLGGDVISASDPNISNLPLQESADGREVVGASIARSASQGLDVKNQLTSIGVRWIALVHDVNWKKLAPTFDAEAGLTRVIDGGALTLYSVDSWQGVVTTYDGAAIESSERLSPWWSVAPSEQAAMHLPFQVGWMRGLSATAQGPFGQIALPVGDGPVWFWPSVLVVLVETFWVVTLLCLACSRLRDLARRLFTRYLS
jgi:hypothetical protein